MTHTTDPRPFRVLGIQQIAIGGTDKQRMKTLWVDMLGLTQTGTFQSERENVDEDILAMGQGAWKVEVDIMQPLDIDKKPAVHTTPLNHIGLWIDDLAAAMEWLTAQGVRFAPGGIRKGHHPRSLPRWVDALHRLASVWQHLLPCGPDSGRICGQNPRSRMRQGQEILAHCVPFRRWPGPHHPQRNPMPTPSSHQPVQVHLPAPRPPVPGPQYA